MNKKLDYEYLYDCYVTHKMSLREMGKMLDCSAMTVLRRLRRTGIETRDSKSGYRNFREKNKSRIINSCTGGTAGMTDEDLEELADLAGIELK